jgi:nucleoid DNA-binding protein
LEINQIIRELLAKHTYISLPGLGSFIQKYEPAKPSADGKGFISPKQTIAFDSSRSFNDEVIENYLCEKMEIDHPSAIKLLDEFISKITEELNKGKNCTFANVGVLSKNKEGEIQFKLAKDLDIALSTYGLKDIEIITPPIAVKPKPSVKVEPKPAPSKTEIKPVRKSSSLKILVVTTIIIGIVALVATFIMIPELRFWETLINTSNTNAISISDTLNKNISRISQSKVKADSSTVKKDSLSSKVDKAITDNSVKKTALYYEEPKIQDNKLYYLIVGSFGKLENAQKLAERYNQRGFKTEIIQGNSMFRVSISQSSDKNKAISEFNKFRNNYPNESIWVLGM